jgi:lipopolysaccharide transport system ATP-binding protein
MTNHAAIRVDGLSKLYRVGARQRGYRTLRESFAEACSAPVRRLRNAFARRPSAEMAVAQGASRLSGENFWALKDVNFEVQPGEVVGIIGRNGAGKSTLLKILSRITEPTSGRIELRGRVGSLLEVGTGFHPELTGRENVYMNGSILGMSRREIARKFDEIVAFAEIDDFLDTPVKRYSSGMYVRLAFAVAAHLEPEILIVDEVLAVGDATFQKRCLDRMGELAGGGRTVLLVSHNLDVLPRICGRAVLLDQGRVRRSGKPQAVIDEYLESHLQAETQDIASLRRTGNGDAKFVGLTLLDRNQEVIQSHGSGDDLVVRMEIESDREIRNVALAVVLRSIRGVRLVTSWTEEAGFRVDLKPGRQTFDCRFRELRIRPGHQFTVSLWASGATVLDSVENIRTVSVLPTPSTEYLSSNHDQGVFVCDQIWSRV